MSGHGQAVADVWVSCHFRRREGDKVSRHLALSVRARQFVFFCHFVRREGDKVSRLDAACATQLDTHPMCNGDGMRCDRRAHCLTVAALTKGNVRHPNLQGGHISWTMSCTIIHIGRSRNPHGSTGVRANIAIVRTYNCVAIAKTCVSLRLLAAPPPNRKAYRSAAIQTSRSAHSREGAPAEQTDRGRSMVFAEHGRGVIDWAHGSALSSRIGARFSLRASFRIGVFTH